MNRAAALALATLAPLAAAACSSSSSTGSTVTDGSVVDARAVETSTGSDGGASDAAGDTRAPADAPGSVDGSDAASPADGSDAGMAGDASSDGGACGPSATYGGGEVRVVGGSVTASLVDETGAAVAAGQPLYICGLDLCSPPGQTTAGGGASIATTLSERRPAFKLGDGIAYATFAIPLTPPTTDFTKGGTGVLATAKLGGKAGAALTAGTAATSGGVTVTLAAGATVAIDALSFSTPDSQLFRAVSIPLTNAAPLLPAAPTGFALLYGVAPAETVICPPAAVTVPVPSGLGWAPGAPVEFWITTDDVGQTYAPYAGWALASAGVVSADGKSATTIAGGGFPLLESFAVRLKN